MAPMMKSVVVALAALVALMGSTEAVTMRGLSAMEDRELATSSTTCITSCQEHAVLLDSAKDKTCLTQYSDCKCQLPTLGNGYCKGAVKTVQTGTYTATCEQTLTPCSASPTSSVTQPVTSSMECISSCPANSVVKDAAKNKSCLNQITDCTCTLPKLGNGYCSGAVKGVITGSNTMRCDQTLTPCTATPTSSVTQPVTSSMECISSCPANSVVKDAAKNKSCLNQITDCTCTLPKLGNGYCSGAVKGVITGSNTMRCDQTLNPCTATPTSSVTQPVTSSMECISSCPANSVVKDAAKNKSCLNQITDCTCTLPKLGNGYCSGAVKGVITGSNTMRCDQTLTPCASTPSSPPTVSPTPFPTKCIRKCPRKSIRTEASAGKTCINQMTDCVCQLPANSNPLCTAHVQTIQTGTNTMKCQQSKTCTKSG